MSESCPNCGQRWKCIGTFEWKQVYRPVEIFFLVLLALIGITARVGPAVIFG